MQNTMPVPRHRRAKSKVTNGTKFLGAVDGRTKWVKRVHDLLAQTVVNLGGEEHVSQAQYLIAKSAAVISVQLEMTEAKLREESGGAVPMPDLLAYQTMANSRRLCLKASALSASPILRRT